MNTKNFLCFGLPFRCVCKSWKFIISNTHLVKMYLHMSTMDPTLKVKPPPYAIIHLKKCSPMLLYELHIQQPITKSRVVAMGLCACLNPIKHMLVCGTHLQDCQENLHSSCMMAFHGFGYDYMSDKYKMVFAFLDPIVRNKTFSKLYTFGNSSWRPIQNLSFLNKCLTVDAGFFVGGNGTLNWVPTTIGVVITNPHAIPSFDLRKETFEEVLLPDFSPDNPLYPVPTTLKDCLCVCYESEQTQFVVWLMKEYGVIESWTKLMKIPCWELGILELQVSGITPFVVPFYMLDNGEVLVYIS